MQNTPTDMIFFIRGQMTINPERIIFNCVKTQSVINYCYSNNSFPNHRLVFQGYSDIFNNFSTLPFNDMISHFIGIYDLFIELKLIAQIHPLFILSAFYEECDNDMKSLINMRLNSIIYGCERFINVIKDHIFVFQYLRDLYPEWNYDDTIDRYYYAEINMLNIENDEIESEGDDECFPIELDESDEEN